MTSLMFALSAATLGWGNVKLTLSTPLKCAKSWGWLIPQKLTSPTLFSYTS